ncbi:uncharacterized protein RHOBADRAFT_54689 [Rhodotorula graminis WP1]|uniref:histidine kinase n=1 Tax=Rhodotorula graminis (strain WP1) TaxID=578459 RepID=A0A0P9IV50_RHOGW|nr:uncharacterized protein RHOBADRAFT_54689 [Rhodotorula graminis WP1]KPV73466.1 hypothetical protein RHOBADRAFT_54689 [Rhodotorula graminis WP1]
MDLLDCAALDVAVVHFAAGPSPPPAPPGATASPTRLVLTKASPAAYRLLGLEPSFGLPPAVAAGELLAGLGDADHLVREQLDDLARRSKALPWGDGFELDYVVGRGASRQVERAVVKVSASTSSSSSPAKRSPDSAFATSSSSTPSPSTTYTVLFLRPARARDRSAPSPSFAASARLSPSPQPSSHLDHDPVPPPLDRAYSSSENMSESGAKSKRRLVTGKDRLHLPHTPDVRNAMSFATKNIAEAPSPPTSSARATPDVSSLELDDSSSTASSTTSRRRGRLPSGLRDAPPTRDPAIADSLINLSRVVEASAGRIAHYRMPINDEDASGAVLSPVHERPDPMDADGASRDRAGAAVASDVEGASELDGRPSPEQKQEVQDALAHRERDARLPLTLANLSNLIETMPQMAFIADPAGQVLWLNASWFRYTGQPSEFNPTFDEWMSMYHPDDLEHAFGVYLGAMQSGDDFSFEYRIKGADGILRWHMCQGRAHYGDDGQRSAWYCNITNIDDLVKTRHDALLVKERTKAVLAGSELTLLTIDVNLTITFCEGKAPSFSSCTDPRQLVGLPFHDVCADEALRDGVRQILDEEVEVVAIQTEMLDAEGNTIYNRYRLVPLHGDPSIPASHPDAKAVSGCIAVGADVTERVRTERALEISRVKAGELAASELAAREASRLKTEFLTTVSHEIRTPIAGILGICELLLADSDRLAEDQRALVDKAVRSGELLLDLVGAVLDVRKVEQGELRLEAAPFALSDALADARLFGVIAQKKGLEFDEQIDIAYKGVLLGDRLRLRQVLANAIGNSIKFTRDGKVTLMVQQIGEDEERVMVRFIVADTGVGIDSDVLPTLFRPFKQASAGTAREYGGSGLGLTIAKNLVEMMGGTIELASKLGEGSRMTITIPFNKAPPGSTTSLADLTADPRANGSAGGAQSPVRPTEESTVEIRSRRRPEDVRILLAEDNDLICEILTRTLRRARFVVDAVDNGQKAVEQVERQEYSVVIMDGQMPGVDGYEATARIRRSHNPRVRNLRIIALTASAIAGDRERCLEAGMSTYLAKPVRAKELEATIWQQVELADLHPAAATL